MQKWWMEIQWHWTVTEGAKVISCLYAIWWNWSPPSEQIIMKYLNVFFKTRSSFRTKLILYESYRYWLFETPRSPTRLNRLRFVVARSLLKFSFDDASRKPRSSTWYGFMRIRIDITAFSSRLRKIQIISSLTLKIKSNIKLFIYSISSFMQCA